MFKVTFTFENGSEVEAFANAGDNLLEVARGANVAIDAPCSGNGACGKCRVQLKSGELDSKKTLHISDEEFEKGWRLACMSKISADVEVLVPVAFLLLWWMLPGIIQRPSICPFSSHVEELNPILYLGLDGFETPGANVANLIGIAMTLVGLPAMVAALCWLQRKRHD